jgi:tetratricopeptide (TPR) repeat protein
VTFYGIMAFHESYKKNLPIMKTLLLLAGMLTCAMVQAQPEPTKDEMAFEHAITLYEDDRKEEALLAFYEFMTVYPDSRLRPSAHFNIGVLQFQRQHYEAATHAFKEILNADYNELDANSLMEPYMLYKHQSSRFLAEISLEQKDYKAVEEYIHLFEYVYPYQHFCGNELSAYAIYKATMKARLYEGQQKVGKAIQILVPYTFQYALASNEALLDLLINILYRHYPQEQVQQELNNALASIQIKNRKRNTDVTMTLFGETVHLDDLLFDIEDSDQQDLDHYQKMVKENILFVRFL